MDRIGEYFVRRLIGEGGMGKVYEAEERLSRRRVALKVLRPELGRSEEGRQMFLNEMTILAHLDHPNIVRSLSCSEVDGELVMALEYLEGETLRQRLARRGRLPWPEAVAIAAQVAAGLGAAHGQEPPIVHRDLKPENLMITGERVRVMDFGIAKVLQAIRKSTSHSVGTLQYMSPEQIDAADVDHRSDIYCLGLILYEALAGAPPFQSESPRELLNLQCTASAPALPDDVRAQLPRGIERVLLRMLEKAPAARPGSAQEVLAALDPFVTAADGGAAASGIGLSAAWAAHPAGIDTPGESRGASARPGALAAGAAGPTALSGVSMSAPISASMSAIPVVGAVGVPAMPPGAARLDTIALLDRAARPRQVSTRAGVAIALALSILAGLVTYGFRAGRVSGAPPVAADVTAPAAAAAAAADAGADAGSEALGKL